MEGICIFHIKARDSSRNSGLASAFGFLRSRFAQSKWFAGMKVLT
jgi:hypothetical protein